MLDLHAILLREVCDVDVRQPCERLNQQMRFEIIAVSGTSVTTGEHVENKDMSEPLLSIRNHHAVACGDPPIIVDDDPEVYIGYFANPFGEQWVFVYDRKTRQANLRGGDVGWNDLHEVRDGTVPGLILGREESMWLAACWSAATRWQ